MLLKAIISSFNALLRSGNALVSYELMKRLPNEVVFDEELFKKENSDLPSDVQQEFIDEINYYKNSLEYFSIKKASRNKIQNREYFRNYFEFKDEKTKKIIYDLQSTNWVLIVDDVFTTGSTIREIVRNIRDINDICQIYIFTLVKGYDGNLNRYIL